MGRVAPRTPGSPAAAPAPCPGNLSHSRGGAQLGDLDPYARGRLLVQEPPGEPPEGRIQLPRVVRALHLQVTGQPVLETGAELVPLPLALLRENPAGRVTGKVPGGPRVQERGQENPGRHHRELGDVDNARRLAVPATQVHLGDAPAVGV